MNLLKFLEPLKDAPVVPDFVQRREESAKHYPPEVLEIHRLFENAGVVLVDEHTKFINSKPKVNESKVERLMKLGFTKVKEVEETKKVIEDTAFSKETIALVGYYQQHYPFNKFITEGQVQEICHKYNLVCGDVDRFRGFVPDANVRDMETFKLKDEDRGLVAREVKIRRLEDFFPSFAEKPKETEVKEHFLQNAEIRKGTINESYYHIYKADETNKYNYAFQSSDGINFYAKDSKNIFGLESLPDIRLSVEKSTLKICAPVKDMDISGLELVEGYKLVRKIEIPDPVVLQPVKGGYLIVTAWGDEASDPIVVNQNFN